MVTSTAAAPAVTELSPGMSGHREDVRRSRLFAGMLLMVLVVGDLSVPVLGGVPLRYVALPAVATVLVLAMPTAVRSWSRMAVVAPPVVAFWFLQLALPLVAMLIDPSLPARAALAVTQPIESAVYVALGYAAAKASPRVATWIIGAIAGAAVVHGVLAVAQIAAVAGVDPVGILQPWIRAQQTVTENVVVGRATGAFLNPNVLGLFGLVAATFLYLAPRGRLRSAGLVGALVSLLAAQSRGVLVAAVVAWVIARGGPAWRSSRRTRGSSVPAVLAAVGASAGLLVVATGNELLWASVRARATSSIASVLSLSARQDNNLAIRLDAWADGFSVLGDAPFGTLVPPQLLLGRALDSDYAYFLTQGSAPLLALYVLTLAATMRLVLVREARRFGLAPAAVLAAVASAGVTQTAISYTPTLLVWVAAGVAVAAVSEGSSRPVGWLPSGPVPARALARPLPGGRRRA